VVTRTGGLPEATEGIESAVSVEPGDPEAIADAVESIIQRWDALRSVAVADARRASTRFAPAAYRAALGHVVAELLDRAAAGRGPVTHAPPQAS
jgi:hypothetical protein